MVDSVASAFINFLNANDYKRDRQKRMRMAKFMIFIFSNVVN